MKWFLTSLLFILAHPVYAGTIILLVDISSSINDENFELQMTGYENAMLNIGPLAYFNLEVVVFDDKPKLISSGDNRSAALAFGDFPRIPSTQRGITCMTDALEFIEIMIPKLEQPVILDISGDGEANCLTDERSRLHSVLDRIAAQGVRINTLFVKSDLDFGDMSPHERNMNSLSFFKSLERNHGFTIVADDFQDFEESLFKKLVFEMVQIETDKNVQVVKW